MFRFLAAFVLAALAIAAQATVDANKASQAQLETAKGIRTGLSGKIVDARKAGAFKEWNDLVERIGGVGPGNSVRFSQADLTASSVAYTTPVAETPASKSAARRPDKAESALAKPAATR